MEQVPLKSVPLTVDGITGDRMTEILEMHADLVRPSGPRSAGDQGPSLARGQNFVIRDGLASGRGATRGHFLALNGMPADRQIHGARSVSGGSLHDGEVGFADLPVCKLRGEIGMDTVVAGDDDASAGLLVETMDDPRTVGFRSLRERSRVMEEGVDERAVLVTRTDMDNHSRGFIDHDEVPVLVQDPERYILGTGSGGRLWGFLLDPEQIALADGFRTSGRFPPQGNPTGLHERLDA
jgi:hypothetical protein